MVTIKFYKEPQRVGGGITEINCDGKCLIIDMGADMDKGFDYEEPNPEVAGLTVGTANCLKNVLILYVRKLRL